MRKRPNRGAERPGKTEVGYLESAVAADQEVLGLEVPARAARATGRQGMGWDMSHQRVRQTRASTACLRVARQKARPVWYALESPDPRGNERWTRIGTSRTGFTELTSANSNRKKEGLSCQRATAPNVRAPTKQAQSSIRRQHTMKNKMIPAARGRQSNKPEPTHRPHNIVQRRSRAGYSKLLSAGVEYNLCVAVWLSRQEFCAVLQ